MQKFEQSVRNMPTVESVEFISKDEGLKQFKESMGDKAYLFDGLEKEIRFPILLWSRRSCRKIRRQSPIKSSK